MTTPDLNLAMSLSLKDKLIAPLQRVISQASSQMRDLSNTSDKTARSTAAVAENLAKIGRNSNVLRQGAGDMGRLADQTGRAAREAAKLDKTYRDINGRLRDSRGKFVGDGAGGAGGAFGMFGNLRGAFAGSMAFSHVVADPLRKAADYDTELRRLANTAYGGRSLDERRAGMANINAGIVGAVRAGGGSRDQAMAALNELVGSGTYKDVNEALAVLPVLMRGSTASGAAAGDLATIAIRARQSMGISDAAGLQDLLDRAMGAGQSGGFELRDMAKWLPQQMAAARSIGLQGMSGMTTLLAANQASVITAGTRDEAGNNLVNLLGKISSSDTARDFAGQGIDLTGSLARANARGMNSLDAFVGLVDKVVGSDPRFVAAQKAAQSAKGSDRAAAMSAQADLLQGSSVGKVIQDRQALMALIGLMNNREYLARVTSDINGSKGTIDSAAALITEGAGYKFDQRNFEVERAQTEAMTGANSAITKLADAQIDLYQRYPGFAEALEGAKVAVMGLTAAAAAAGAINLLSGGAGILGRTTVAGATAVGGAALGIGGATLAGMGAIASMTSTRTVENNLENFSEVADNPMLSAMSGDAGIAAAIMSVAERPVQVNVHLDGRQIEAAVTARQDQKGKRQ